jgi:hypothetical protein
VVLFERNTQIGRKLLATGNGRCNLTNSQYSAARYHGATPEFIESVISRFDQHAAMEFFGSLGLLLKEEDNGRIFPRTNQAGSVVEVLKQRLAAVQVDVLLESQVKSIESSTAWRISLASKKVIESDNLILATGGRAAYNFGSTGDGLYWAGKLGHSLTAIYPALVPIETVETWPKDVQGNKLEARVRATTCHSELDSESIQIGVQTGDVLFTSYGVSGTAVMSLAGAIAPLLTKSEVMLHIDLFPDMTAQQLDEAILRIFRGDENKALGDALIGLLPNGMIPILTKLAGFDERRQVGLISYGKRMNLAKTLKDITLTVSKPRPLKEAQVTSGGLDTAQINPHTLESKILQGLYFAGEIIDVDGDSGGFNLQWAWSSGYVAGLVNK